jgi:hypothetical protein
LPSFDSEYLSVEVWHVVKAEGNWKKKKSFETKLDLPCLKMPLKCEKYNN